MVFQESFQFSIALEKGFGAFRLALHPFHMEPDVRKSHKKGNWSSGTPKRQVPRELGG